MLADRLISLAQEADRVGLRDSASRMIGLAYRVLDDDGASSANFGDDLIASTTEAVAIMRGEIKPARFYPGT